MAKKIQNKRYLVNRAVYKAVKKYDHQQFENFCTDIYKSGWEDGAIWSRPYGMLVGKVDRKKYPDADQEYRFEEVQNGHQK